MLVEKSSEDQTTSSYQQEDEIIWYDFTDATRRRCFDFSRRHFILVVFLAQFALLTASMAFIFTLSECNTFSCLNGYDIIALTTNFIASLALFVSCVMMISVKLLKHLKAEGFFAQILFFLAILLNMLHSWLFFDNISSVLLTLFVLHTGFSVLVGAFMTLHYLTRTSQRDREMIFRKYFQKGKIKLLVDCDRLRRELEEIEDKLSKEENITEKSRLTQQKGYISALFQVKREQFFDCN